MIHDLYPSQFEEKIYCPSAHDILDYIPVVQTGSFFVHLAMMLKDIHQIRTGQNKLNRAKISDLRQSRNHHALRLLAIIPVIGGIILGIIDSVRHHQSIKAGKLFIVNAIVDEDEWEPFSDKPVVLNAARPLSSLADDDEGNSSFEFAPNDLDPTLKLDEHDLVCAPRIRPQAESFSEITRRLDEEIHNRKLDGAGRVSMERITISDQKLQKSLNETKARLTLLEQEVEKAKQEQEDLKKQVQALLKKTTHLEPKP